MRRILAAGWMLAVGGLLAAQDPPMRVEVVSRYGYDYNPKKYPQDSPQRALASILKAVEEGQGGYLLAHLADPAFVDRTVAEYIPYYSGAKREVRAFLAFRKLLEETRAHFRNDPTSLRELRLVLKEGEWDVKEKETVVTHPSLGGRKVFFRVADKRWYLENRQE